DRHDRHHFPGPLDLGDRYFGEPHVTDQSLSLEIPDRFELLPLLDFRIDPVELPEIDPLHPEPAEAALQLPPKIFGLAILDPAAGTGPLQSGLRCDHQSWVGMQSLGDELLGHMWSIRVGRVKEVHPQVNGALKDPE